MSITCPNCQCKIAVQTTKPFVLKPSNTVEMSKDKTDFLKKFLTENSGKYITTEKLCMEFYKMFPGNAILSNKLILKCKELGLPNGQVNKRINGKVTRCYLIP